MSDSKPKVFTWGVSKWGNGSVLGDFALDWGQRANLEHLPEYASADAVARA